MTDMLINPVADITPATPGPVNPEWLITDQSDIAWPDAQPSATNPRGPLTVSRDPDGGWIAADVFDAVYGTGATPEEAIADYLVALQDRVRYLQQNASRLHPRLARELQLLQRLIPRIH